MTGICGIEATPNWLPSQPITVHAWPPVIREGVRSTAVSGHEMRDIKSESLEDQQKNKAQRETFIASCFFCRITFPYGLYYVMSFYQWEMYYYNDKSHASTARMWRYPGRLIEVPIADAWMLSFNSAFYLFACTKVVQVLPYINTGIFMYILVRTTWAALRSRSSSMYSIYKYSCTGRTIQGMTLYGVQVGKSHRGVLLGCCKLAW